MSIHQATTRRLRLLAQLPAILLFNVMPVATPQVAAQSTAVADAGLLAFNSHCGTCHTIRPNDNRLGPSLYGILDRPSGQAQGYAGYSFAMKAGSVTWDATTLDAFIADPDAVVSGHCMRPFAPTSDAQSRKEIVNFIKACERCSAACPSPKKCTPRPSSTTPSVRSPGRP